MVNASTGVTNLNCWLDYTPRGILLSTHAGNQGNQGGSENTQPESVDTAPLLTIRNANPGKDRLCGLDQAMARRISRWP